MDLKGANRNEGVSSSNYIMHQPHSFSNWGPSSKFCETPHAMLEASAEYMAACEMPFFVDGGVKAQIWKILRRTRQSE